jgi:adrenodoxin-NADP+ reductase
LNVDLTRGDTAVIIGQGNVALDVARMLLTPVELLQKTDICSHALEALSHSTIKKVIVVGRGGPLDVAFTIKELRALIKLPRCQTIINMEDIKGFELNMKSLPRPRKRITELMKNTASGDVDDSLHKSWELKFLRSPVECLSASNGYVSGIKLEVNKLQVDKNGYVRAVGTGKYESIDCSLILRSIGYKGISIDPNVPFDKRSGVILNNRGRVINDHGGDIINGLYCSGWMKRGPTGVILDTMNDAFETAGAIVEDINNSIITLSQDIRLF